MRPNLPTSRSYARQVRALATTRAGLLVIALLLAGPAAAQVPPSASASPSASPAAATPTQTPREQWPETIEDNSFLIEEAYNQEPGVVQFIFNFFYQRPSRIWQTSFTNEWPVPDERNQLSYTLPYTIGPFGQLSGVGDVLLNYRYQLCREDRQGFALAPRFSLSVPTGSERKGLGLGAVGYQVGVPVSKRVSKGLAVHFNLGATYFPGVRVAAATAGHTRTDLWWTSEGTSAIWLASPVLNLVLEAVAYQTQVADAPDSKTRVTQAILNPGLRYALNFPSGQLVLGVSVPVGVTRASPDPSLFLYLSWEAPVWRPGRR